MLTFDTREAERKLNADIRTFIGWTGRDSQKELKNQGRLLTRDLIGATPPFGAHAFNRREESYNEQRRIGEAAVERDIRKVFIPLRLFVEQLAGHNPELALALSLAGGLGAVNRVSRKQSQRASRVDMDALQAIFRNMGKEGMILPVVNPSLHEAARNRFGRVRRSRLYVVVNERSINQYIREKKAHVGKAKAGWLKAALGLGLKAIPDWIRRHLVAGIFTDRSSPTFETQSITIGNLIEYGADFDPARFSAALENRSRAMKLTMEAMMKRQAERAKAA